MFEEADAIFSIKEVLEALCELKLGKASGVDGVKAEYLKGAGDVCAKWMVRLLNVLAYSPSYYIHNSRKFV